MEGLLTLKKLAEQLTLSQMTLRRMLYKKEFPYVRLGARRIGFRPAEVEEWLKNHSVRVQDGETPTG